MAFARRAGRGIEGSIWPGFVDGLTGLLLILMFVLSIFMIVQFSLRETILGQGARLDAQQSTIEQQLSEIGALSRELSGLADALDFERTRGATLEFDLKQEQAAALSARERAEALDALAADLRADVAAEQAARGALESRLSGLEGQIAGLESDKAATEAELAKAEEDLLLQAAAAAELKRSLDARALALEERKAAIEAAEGRILELEADLEASGEEGRARLRAIAQAAEEARAQKAATARLETRLKVLTQQMARLQASLGAAEADGDAKDLEIARLGEQLTVALQKKVSDLERFRSVFFEQMEQVLGGREDIKRDGDRFVFQSEVLFDAGSADLGRAGLAELAQLGAVLRQLEASVPAELDWILRVDGHTDPTPIRSPRFADNWELSQARALSVVRYLIEAERVPPARLAATGFGQFRPVDRGESPEALARNRRIEFKFTER